MDYRITLGVLAVLVGFVGYAYYFRDMFRGKTKPHAFSWFVWSILTGIAFAAQVTSNAGPGAWVTGVTAVVCFIIFLYALCKGKRDFPLADWLCLAASIIAILLWWATSNPFWSVILISVTDMVAFVPTFRKAYHKPYEETLAQYILASCKSALGIAALRSFSVTTWLYLATLVIMNGAFAVMLVWRRSQKSAKALFTKR
jgi:hypothetical protein